jgi:Putative metallopeptidase family (DUF6782)
VTATGIRRAVVGLVVVIAAAVSAVPITPALASKGVPAQWDPRVREFVTFVEKTRGLEFDRPIPIEFLGDKAFQKEVVTDDEDLTKQDRQFGKAISGDLFALGLVGPDFDYNAESSALDAAGIVGYYDQDTKKMVVRGKNLDDTDVRVTIVHELTHALQDQQFDLSKMQDATKSSGEDLALTALIEGDATWVEEEYLASLPQKEQDAYYGDSGTVAEEPELGTASDQAFVLDLVFSSPYELGYWFVDFLRTGGSTRKLDAVFRKPPPSDEQILDPVAFVEHQRPDAPPAPKLEPGETKRGKPDELGALTLAMVLGSRLDARTALTAVTGWKGDSYRGFTRDGAACIRAAIAMDDAGEAKEMTSALDAWAAKGPAGAATATRDGADVGLVACGSAAAALPTQDALLATFSALAQRYANFEQFAGNDKIRPRDMRCLGDLYSTDPELTAIFQSAAAELTPDQERLLRTRTRAYAATCGLATTA